MLQTLRNFIARPEKPAVLVIGDAMLDHYIWGEATRLSPEAPVPVVHVKRDSYSLGGAANVALNLSSLGAVPALACVLGDDEQARVLRKILGEKGIGDEAVFTDKNRMTTVKTRVMAGSHQLVRIDREVTGAVNTEAPGIGDAVSALIGKADLVLLSDYDKGFLPAKFCAQIIAQATASGKKVIVDPKGTDYRKYKGAYIIKPNRKELSDASGISRIKTDDDLRKAAAVIFAQTNVACLVVTLSEEGIAIITPEQLQRLPVQVTDVFDVTGAGDTVLATLSYGLAGGLTIENACIVANYAAAIAIRRVGNAAVSLQDILDELEKKGPEKAW